MNGVYNGAGAHDPALYAWVEVTQPFLHSCEELHLGELLHDDMFGLFEVAVLRTSNDTVDIYILNVKLNV
jgi:hypothetical protein